MKLKFKRDKLNGLAASGYLKFYDSLEPNPYDYHVSGYYMEGFRNGYALLMPEVEKLVEAFDEAVEGLAIAHDYIQHCFEHSCVPTRDELNSALAYCRDSKKALAAFREFIGEKE